MNGSEDSTIQGNIPKDFYPFFLAMMVLNALIALMAVCLNFLVILTFIRTSSIRTPSNLLVLGLAISDFITALILVPFYCMFLSFSLEQNIPVYLISNQIVFGLATVLLVVSFYTVVAVTFDRFLAITLHLRYKQFITRQRYAVLLACIWLGSLTCGICRAFFREQKEMRITFFALFSTSVGINIIFLIKISQAVRRHTAQIRTQEQSAQLSAHIPKFKKSVKTMHLIIGAFVFCYSPYLLIAALDASLNSDVKKFARIKIVAQTMLMANSLANPVIYCIRIDEIRQSVLKLLKKFTT